MEYKIINKFEKNKKQLSSFSRTLLYSTTDRRYPHFPHDAFGENKQLPDKAWAYSAWFYGCDTSWFPENSDWSFFLKKVRTREIWFWLFWFGSDCNQIN